MTGWWQRLLAALQPADLRHARWEINALSQQVDHLRASLDDARNKHLAADAAAKAHARKLRRIADVLADQSLSTAAANQRVRQVLVEGPEPGPVSGGGPDAA